MWDQNIKSFSNETLTFSVESSFFCLAKTVWVLQILSLKSTRNFGPKHPWALKNHVVMNILICSSDLTDVH